MILFMDTNVLLDWLLDRKDTYADEATQLIEFSEKGKVKLIISSGSLYTITYVLEKSGKKGVVLRNTLKQILALLEVCSSSTNTYINACNLSIKDLEDAYQYQIASENSAMYFVTGNIKDFLIHTQATLPVLTPDQMLQILLKPKSK